MKKILAPFVAALRFLTIIKIPFWSDESATDATKNFAKSLIYYPLVGLLLGLLLAGVYWLLRDFVPPLLMVGILLGLWVWLTGALHLDGLADCADGVAASHKDVTTRDRIMKEPTIGAMAVITLIILLLLKFSALASIFNQFVVPDRFFVLALIVTPVISRWAMAYMVYRYPYKRNSGVAAVLKENKSITVIIVPTIVTLVIILICLGLAGLLLMALAIVAIHLIAAFYRSKLGGLSGDTYGAANEIMEAFVLVIIVTGFFNNVWLM